MALMDVDLVAVDRALWERVKAGDPQSRGELKTILEGEILYVHALSVSDNEDLVFVTVRELDEQDIVTWIEIHTGSQ